MWRHSARALFIDCLSTVMLCDTGDTSVTCPYRDAPPPYLRHTAWNGILQRFLCLSSCNIYYEFFHSWNVLIYLKTFSEFFRNSSVCPHTDCESNSGRSWLIQPSWLRKVQFIRLKTFEQPRRQPQATEGAPATGGGTVPSPPLASLGCGPPFRGAAIPKGRHSEKSAILKAVIQGRCGG